MLFLPKSRKLRRINTKHNPVFLPKNQLMKKLASSIGYWLLLLTPLTLLSFSGWMFFQKIFLKNPEYSLRQLDLNPNDALNEKELLTLTSLNTSNNLFQINPESITKTLLSQPSIAHAQVERILPDTLKIRITARKPLAWISPSPSNHQKQIGALLIDDQRIIYPCPPQQWNHAQNLPTLYLTSLPPNQPISNTPSTNEEISHAIHLLLSAQPTLNSTPWTIRSIRQPNNWSLELTTNDNTIAIFSLHNQEKEFKKLNQALAHAQRQGYQIATINLIPERNIPITLKNNPSTPTTNTTKPTKPPSHPPQTTPKNPPPPSKPTPKNPLNLLLQQEQTSADP